MSGGGGTQTTTQTQSVPPWLQNSAQDFLGAAGQVSQLPYQSYTGQRVADLSPLQQSSIQGIANLAGGTGSMQAGEDMLTNTLQGNYSNPFATSGVSAGSNPYMGQSPYFDASLGKGINDIVHGYQQGTSADTTRLFNLSGAFGGSAHQNVIADNERQLGDTLSNYVNTARQGQYDRSANLAESGLGRDLNAQQFNATQGSNAFENERNRQMQAVGGSTNLYSNLLNGQNTALQAGNTERNQNQQLLDSQYGDFTDWRNYPAQQLGIFGNALGSVTGAAPRTTTTDSPLAPPDRVGQGLGVMALGNYLGKGSGK